MCDVDETVAPAVKKWIKWYENLVGGDLKPLLRTDGRANDLLELMHNHNNPLEFWRDSELYHGMKPRRNSVEVLGRLSARYDIVFVSNSMPEHSHSKEMFLKKHFPFHSGYIATVEKRFIKAAVFIDDYKTYLRAVKEYQPECECIHIKTFLSNESDEFPLLEWLEIEDYLVRKGL